MSLRESRCAFTALAARLLVAITERPWPYGRVEVVMDEGTIHTPRRTRLADGTTAYLADAVHKTRSRHHDGLALDILIYVDGEYLADGGHPIWRDIDAMAHALDPRLGLGIAFRDSNHLSWAE